MEIKIKTQIERVRKIQGEREKENKHEKVKK